MVLGDVSEHCHLIGVELGLGAQAGKLGVVHVIGGVGGQVSAEADDGDILAGGEGCPAATVLGGLTALEELEGGAGFHGGLDPVGVSLRASRKAGSSALKSFSSSRRKGLPL